MQMQDDLWVKDCDIIDEESFRLFKPIGDYIRQEMDIFLEYATMLAGQIKASLSTVFKKCRWTIISPNKQLLTQ